MPIQHETIRSFRRTLSIQVHPQKGVIVRAPRFMSDRRIEKFLEEKEDWINKHLENFKERKQRNEALKQRKFEPGQLWPFLGEEIQLPVHTKKYVEQWYKEKAIKVFVERTGMYSAMLSELMGKNIFPKEIKIRSYRSRWGTCSRDNVITYNWRAIVAPQPVVDYLVIHELCHIVHKNHARQFYDLVSKLDPNYKAHRKYLRSSTDLHFTNL